MFLTDVITYESLSLFCFREKEVVELSGEVAEEFEGGGDDEGRGDLEISSLTKLSTSPALSRRSVSVMIPTPKPAEEITDVYLQYS